MIRRGLVEHREFKKCDILTNATDELHAHRQTLAAVDLNPRRQRSTTLAVQAELRAGRLPLMAALFAVQSGVLGSSDIKPLQDSFRHPLNGSQLNLRCRLHDESVGTGHVAPGAYNLAGFEHKRGAFRPSNLQDKEILVTGAVPRKGVTVEPGVWLMRVVSWKRAAGLDSTGLLRWASRAADVLNARLRLQPTEPVRTDYGTKGS